ncbi:MAG: PfkB family carbohydrate kinase [Alphaproteobacteria bacterium]|nr:PfkB family carbohydrate kinase [Alphaproteobacteria bacterium]
MAVRVFFCGEFVADLLEQNQGSGDFRLLLGGSQFHGAMGASKAVKREGMDVKVGFVGPLSNDMFGERFFKTLQDSKIDTSAIKRVERNTTLAVVSVRPGQENSFSFYGRDTAEQMTKIEDLPQKLETGGDKKICCFGSISTVMEPARFAWLEFARKQRQESLVFYDLNTRPSIARDREQYRKIVLEWASIAHVMKASDADIAWAYPDMTPKQVAEIWLAQGASMAVFTKGMHGSEAYTKKVSAEAKSLDLVVYNTVGAGDNFNAGLTIEFARKSCLTQQDVENLTSATLMDILRGANNTAAYHLISIGAKPRDVTEAVA